MRLTPLSNYQSSPSSLPVQVGTGGQVNDGNILVFVLNNPTPYIKLAPKNSELYTGPIESLTFIRETFGLSLTDLAKIFTVTRPTIYSWLNGKEPSKKDFKKIQHVSEIARRVEQLKIIRIDVLIHRPIFSNQSFLDLIINNHSAKQWENALETLKKLSIKEAEGRKKQKGTHKGRRSSNDVNDDYSTPIF